MVTAMTSTPRKLGEIWVTGDGCQLRVETAAFTTASRYAGQQAVVEFAAEYALVEVLRRIVADYDRAGNARVMTQATGSAPEVAPAPVQNEAAP